MTIDDPTQAPRASCDPADVEALQKEVLDALRAGMIFFTASKEGGSHLSFDGKVFLRADYGEEPNLRETYEDDAAMVVFLRKFFDWDARYPVYPRHPSELEVWTHIKGRLMKRRG